mgnify:CR=1 FL=1
MKKLMKSQVLTVALAMLTMPLFAQINVGGGIAFGSEIENLGFTAKGTYSINEQWEGAASFTYFIPKSFGTIDWTLWALNLDGHYLKNVNEKFTIYPLAGLSIGGFTFDNNFSFGGVDGGKTTTTEVGINLGGGAYLGISEKMKGYAEIKYIVGGFDQLVLNAGVLFNL